MERGWWIGAAAAAALVAALAVPAVRHLREDPPPPPAPVHLTFEPPPGSDAGSGDEALDAAISPDETEIVFVATSRGVAQLWRRALATGVTGVLPGTDGAQLPAWKQTGGVVSFFAGGRLRQLSLSDGTVADLADAPTPAGAAWMPDGSLLFAPDTSGPIRRMLTGRVTDATTLGPGDRGHRFPSAVAEGDGAFTYVAVRDNGRRTVRLVTRDGERDLTDTSGHAQITGRVLVYARDGVLLGQPFDPATRTVSGRSTPLATAVSVSPTGHAMFAASPRLLLFSDGAPRPRDIAWFDLAGTEMTRIAEPGDYWQLRLSPDDRIAAVTLVDPLLRTLDVFTVPATGTGDARPLTRALAADSDPVWSPDGRSVLFRSMQSGRPALHTRLVGPPGAPEEPVPTAESGDTATDWRGNRLLVHTAGGGATGADIWMIDLADGAREPVATTGFNETDGRWSPDGTWVAYVADESGRPDVYALRGGTAAERIRVSFAGGSRPRWSRDGRSIFFVRGSRVMRADRAAVGTPRFNAAVPVLDTPGIRDVDVAHRSDRLAVLLAAPSATSPAIRAIVNWTPLER